MVNKITNHSFVSLIYKSLWPYAYCTCSSLHDMPCWFQK